MNVRAPPGALPSLLLTKVCFVARWFPSFIMRLAHADSRAKDAAMAMRISQIENLFSSRNSPKFWKDLLHNLPA